MRIFLAGATGVVGRYLAPALIERGHEVVGTTRSSAKVESLRASGVEPVVVDGLDADGVLRAVSKSKPDVVVHQLTGLGTGADFKHFDRSFAETNKLRTRGTDNLLAAARASGAGRFVAQSFTSWPFPRTGGPAKTEADPLDPSPIAASRESYAAIVHVEEVVAGASDLAGVALRYGGFYGPGTSLGRDGEITEMVRSRKLPLVGSGEGVWSFIHIADVASATVCAIEGSATGIFHIVDDEPAPVRVWLPYLASALGAKPPLKVPAFVAKLLIGEMGVAMMTQIRGASNAKAKRELGWQLTYPSWREGFRTGL
ncbi:NAD-dependent epimerase/dehydratase family protein [Tenggerimyces flavus]|uniref:NAD-dependent epimerase/dehydratase family protein n=1 Tax=Tenggerimyces flavus TaxID=1708749 RepID=A0ABV7Y496_9ACTN|nr:NAD(P)-dependent oxidoreductase [Tenggerimyces flavus]MBM7790733.1 nucleoside-diphosphate-sugar epimerase [Tenggerimyces flavus]